MIIVKCKRKNCEGHLVGWDHHGTPRLLKNKTHTPKGKVEITPEIRKQLEQEYCSQPFNTFMSVIEEESKLE